MTYDSTVLAVGLDLGGTKISGGVVDGSGRVVERLVCPARALVGRDTVVEALLEAIGTLTRRHRVRAVGIGAAGLIDWPRGHVRWSPNNDYHDLDLRFLIENRTGLPAVVDNDANVAAWAEAHVATDRQARDHMVMLTVGTGLGGGFVLGGEVYRGATGVAAEVGHLLVDSRGEEVCSCGRTGHLESVASGTALGRAGRRAAAADPHGLLARLAGDPDRVTGLTVQEAAYLGDPTALALFDRLGSWLGLGASVLTSMLDLRLIIVGGGLVAAGEFYLGAMHAALERHVFAREHRELPSIALARLGPDAGWIGAGLLALHEHSATEINGAGVPG